MSSLLLNLFRRKSIENTDGAPITESNGNAGMTQTVRSNGTTKHKQTNNMVKNNANINEGFYQNEVVGDKDKSNWMTASGKQNNINIGHHAKTNGRMNETDTPNSADKAKHISIIDVL